MPINEAGILRRSRRRGYCARKSRQRKHLPNVDNRGEYMLIDAGANIIVRRIAAIAGLAGNREGSDGEILVAKIKNATCNENYLQAKT